MTVFADAREAVALELEQLYPSYKVYRWYPPGAPVVPCVIVAPDEIQPVSVSGHTRYNYNLKIAVMSAAQTADPTSVENLETDLETLIAWAGPLAQEINIGPARYGDANVFAVGLTIPYPVKIPTGD